MFTFDADTPASQILNVPIKWHPMECKLMNIWFPLKKNISKSIWFAIFISSVIVQALLKCHDSLIAASRSSRRFQRFFGGMALFASLTFCSDRFDPGFIDLTTKREHTINIPFTLISHINNTNRKIYIYTLRSTIRIRIPFIGGGPEMGLPQSSSISDWDFLLQTIQL